MNIKREIDKIGNEYKTKNPYYFKEQSKKIKKILILLIVILFFSFPFLYFLRELKA
jgi:hypothetical protein